MSAIVKEVQLELTPTDIVRAIRAFSREERDELILEIQRLLIEQDTLEDREDEMDTALGHRIQEERQAYARGEGRDFESFVAEIET